MRTLYSSHPTVFNIESTHRRHSPFIRENFPPVESRRRNEVRTNSRKSSAAELSVAEPLPGFASGMQGTERRLAVRHPFCKNLGKKIFLLVSKTNYIL